MLLLLLLVHLLGLRHHCELRGWWGQGLVLVWLVLPVCWRVLWKHNKQKKRGKNSVAKQQQGKRDTLSSESGR